MPVGYVGVWKQIYAQDFTQSVARGSFLGSRYADQLLAYDGPDTSGRGRYDADSVLSVQDGRLTWDIGTVDGVPRVAGVAVRHPDTGWGEQYGRFSFRLRAEVAPGYKVVGILWPDSDGWGEGEIDFPEVNELVSDQMIYANRRAGHRVPPRAAGGDGAVRLGARPRHHRPGGSRLGDDVRPRAVVQRVGSSIVIPAGEAVSIAGSSRAPSANGTTDSIRSCGRRSPRSMSASIAG